MPKNAPKPEPKFYKAEQGLFTAKEIQLVEGMAAIGATVEEIAIVFKISKKTMERRMEVQPEIYDALKAGKVNAKMKVRKAAFDMAASGRNPFMTQFWLRCQDGWKDRHHVTVSTEDNPSVIQADIVGEIMNMSTEQIQSEIQTLTLQLSSGTYKVENE